MFLFPGIRGCRHEEKDHGREEAGKAQQGEIIIGMPKGEDRDSYAGYTETLDSIYFIKLKVKVM